MMTRAHGVDGLSRSLSMREVSGSIPDVSILFFLSSSSLGVGRNSESLPPSPVDRTTRYYAAAARETLLLKAVIAQLAHPNGLLNLRPQRWPSQEQRRMYSCAPLHTHDCLQHHRINEPCTLLPKSP
jgi:hypothetical protein